MTSSRARERQSLEETVNVTHHVAICSAINFSFQEHARQGFFSLGNIHAQKFVFSLFGYVLRTKQLTEISLSNCVLERISTLSF